MDDEIKLPPIARGEYMPYSEQDLISYARAAVRKDRESRKAPNPAPVVHRERVELTCDGGAWTRALNAPHGRTAAIVYLYWTDDGDAWIEREQNAANAPDGGQR